jgi:hypothetical protein
MDLVTIALTSCSGLVVAITTAYITARFTRKAEREKSERQLQFQLETAEREAARERERWSRERAFDRERWERERAADASKLLQERALARAAARAAKSPEAEALTAQNAIGYFVIDENDNTTPRDRRFIAPGDRLIAGRDKMCDFPLDVSFASKRHCGFDATDMAVFVLDFHSTNGTFVNGERVADKQELQDGDHVTISGERSPLIVFYRI